jgi:hypothetical protein
VKKVSAPRRGKSKDSKGSGSKGKDPKGKGSKSMDGCGKGKSNGKSKGGGTAKIRDSLRSTEMMMTAQDVPEMMRKQVCVLEYSFYFLIHLFVVCE